MVAPLVVAALGLAKQKKDQKDANVENSIRSWMAYEEAQKRHAYDTQAAIAARRAARAGDSGYMQAAYGHAFEAPRFQQPEYVGTDKSAVLRMAAGLAAQNEADAAETDLLKEQEAQQLAWGDPDDPSLAKLWGR